MGSSSSSRSGFDSSSRHSATRRRSPPESFVTSASAGREPQRVHRDLELTIEVPAVDGVDLVLQLGLLSEELVEVGVGLTHRVAHVFEPVEQAFGVRHAVGDVPEHVLGRVELRFLGQVARH